jgi:hypothetical protein
MNKNSLRKILSLSDIDVSLGVSGCVGIDSIKNYLFSSNIFDFVEVDILGGVSESYSFNILKDKILYLNERFGVQVILKGESTCIRTLSITGCWGIYL